MLPTIVKSGRAPPSPQPSARWRDTTAVAPTGGASRIRSKLAELAAACLHTFPGVHPAPTVLVEDPAGPGRSRLPPVILPLPPVFQPVDEYRPGCLIHWQPVFQGFTLR